MHTQSDFCNKKCTAQGFAVQCMRFGMVKVTRFELAGFGVDLT